MQLHRLTHQLQPHQRTYQRVHDGLLETNKQFIRERRQTINKQKWLGKLRYFLFSYPIAIFVISPILFLLLSLCTYIVSNYVGDILIKDLLVRFFKIMSLTSLTMTLFMLNITPRLNVGLHERWSRVKNVSLRDGWHNNKTQQKRDVNKAIHAYKSEAEPLSFLLNFLWSGIFVSCLSDPDFQKALIAMLNTLTIDSVIEVFRVNLFGAWCLLLLPFVFLHHFIKYQKPITQLEYIYAQIELNE